MLFALFKIIAFIQHGLGKLQNEQLVHAVLYSAGFVSAEFNMLSVRSEIQLYLYSSLNAHAFYLCFIKHK